MFQQKAIQVEKLEFYFFTTKLSNGCWDKATGPGVLPAGVWTYGAFSSSSKLWNHLPLLPLVASLAGVVHFRRYSFSVKRDGEVFFPLFSDRSYYLVKLILSSADVAGKGVFGQGPQTIFSAEWSLWESLHSANSDFLLTNCLSRFGLHFETLASMPGEALVTSEFSFNWYKKTRLFLFQEGLDFVIVVNKSVQWSPFGVYKDLLSCLSYYFLEVIPDCLNIY